MTNTTESKELFSLINNNNYIFIFSSNNIKAFDTNNPDLITMVNSGEATFHFQTKLMTLCPMTDDEVRK